MSDLWNIMFNTRKRICNPVLTWNLFSFYSHGDTSMIICDPFQEQFGHGGAFCIWSRRLFERVSLENVWDLFIFKHFSSTFEMKVDPVGWNWIQCFHVAQFKTQPIDLLQKILSYLTRFLCQEMTRKIISLRNPSLTFALLSWLSLRWLINWCLRQGGMCAIINIFTMINRYLRQGGRCVRRIRQIHSLRCSRSLKTPLR